MEDPDIFHIKAKLVATMQSGTSINLNDASRDVLLYIKNDELYETSPCCGLLVWYDFSSKLSIISDVQVITGKVATLRRHVHHINLGLKITSKTFWFGKWERGTKLVKIYETPDAVELARKIDPRVVAVPTTINMTLAHAYSGGGH